MLRAFFLLPALALLLPACGGGSTSTAKPEEAPIHDPGPADNSRTSLDWAGTYTGTVPCADCEGIATTISLERTGTYRAESRYLGKNDEIFTKKGLFTWEDDGGRIVLEGMDGGSARYRVAEGRLFQLDNAGERITGALADRYILRLVTETDAWPLRGTTWKLVEVMGEPVTNPEGRMPANMLLSAEENRVSGNSGCNSFFSTYTLDEATKRIRFEQAGSTMMACQDMSIERAFHKALLEVENYSMEAGSLSLNSDRMASLLRFEAVDM